MHVQNHLGLYPLLRGTPALQSSRLFSRRFAYNCSLGSLGQTLFLHLERNMGLSVRLYDLLLYLDLFLIGYVMHLWKMHLLLVLNLRVEHGLFDFLKANLLFSLDSDSVGLRWLSQWRSLPRTGGFRVILLHLLSGSNWFLVLQVLVPLVFKLLSHFLELFVVLLYLLVPHLSLLNSFLSNWRNRNLFPGWALDLSHVDVVLFRINVHVVLAQEIGHCSLGYSLSAHLLLDLFGFHLGFQVLGDLWFHLRYPLRRSLSMALLSIWNHMLVTFFHYFVLRTSLTVLRSVHFHFQVVLLFGFDVEVGLTHVYKR